ncbi:MULTISPECIES: YaiI/YqxD family protein [Modicisalibacter]|uniref:YaiI/YqxD family protein n=1 Tax=Modicisalibacter TaxID=574347 RepID=UPI00100AC9AA|nr:MULTISPECIES: YaiI/YqxD family protein [Halomonadaceae]MBZ9560173.1 YaiI/YqxD family protein [Modicisalibacter sp. R2A 31.J]MBZ9576081.1 YaiI/YqxD family protein [Modicisalibacter sp. MOD 31.J]
MPNLWVDADACPRAARDILIRAAERTATPTWLVANHTLPLPPSRWVKGLSVASGFDAADHEIVRRIAPGDLLVTADLPLAMEALDKGASVMTNRGESLTADNIRARVQMRDFMETLRASGEHTGGPKSYSDVDRREFANALDRWLAKNR